MSRDCWESNKTLLPVYVEIGKGIEPAPNEMINVNVDSFESCFRNILYPRSPNGPEILDKKKEKIYSVYGVVSRSAPGGTVNILEEPISRTFLGYLEDKVLEEDLPKTWEALNHFNSKKINETKNFKNRSKRENRRILF